MKTFLINSEIAKKFGITDTRALRLGKKVKCRIGESGRIEYCAEEIEAILKVQSEQLTEIPEGFLNIVQLAARFNTSRETIRKMQSKGNTPPAHGIAAIGESRNQSPYYSIEEWSAYFNLVGKPKKGARKGEPQEPTVKYRGNVTKLRSGKIVPRRVVIAPDHWGLRE